MNDLMMLFHPFFSFGFVIALTICLSTQSTSQDTTTDDGSFSCYQGSIQSNTKGEIPRHSERNLTPSPCEEPISLATIQPTTASTAFAENEQNSSQTSAIPTVLATTSQQQNASLLVNWCSVILHFSSESVSTNSTWTANFSCLPATAECPKNMYCCKTSNCNDIQFFQQHSHAEIATVSSCHVMGSQNGTGPVPVHQCPSGSEYCYNRTVDGLTSFGCSAGNTQISCRNITVDNKDRCVTGRSTFCCCASDNCNSNTSSVIPTVPTTTHYVVTASKPSISWTLVLLIACGFLVGGVVGVVATVIYRRWKKKQNANGPLNISYSRVRADLTDEDNIFSY